MPSPTRSSHRETSLSAPSSSHRHHREHRSRHSHSHRHRPRESSRSRSPHRSDRHKSDRHHRHRDGDRHERRHRDAPTAPAKPIVLPYQARELSGRDLKTYEPMFGMYLDIQKQKYIEDMSEEEVKGRWKSFIQKWNRGELAEGWYDPATLAKARQNAQEEPLAGPGGDRGSPEYNRGERGTREAAQDPPVAEDDQDDDDEYGPSLPQGGSARGGSHLGPTIPNMQDLELKREIAKEDAIAARGASRDHHRAEIRTHKSALRQLEDEIAPRAEPGTRERQLEKRREVAASNRAFADSMRGGSPEAAPEEDLMGGDNDLAAMKREKEKDQRKKNEREIRREEILRARTAEREERAQAYRQKEQETMSFLQALAKQRYG
ncbi:hypothetical protein N7461_000289 [Penicillium sp. DV-2018c]|nr:hypothetical protein N7461_000289 [Penicillium sp. DV-2018c]